MILITPEEEREEVEDFETPIGMANNSDSSFTDNMRWQLELDYDDFKHGLMGDIRDHATGDWHPSKHPLINEEGANVIINFLEPLTNKNLILSDMDEREIGDTMIWSAKVIRNLLIRNMDRYEIEKKSLDYIDEYVKNFIHPSLKRCKDGGEKKFLKPIMKFIDQKILKKDETESKGYFN